MKRARKMESALLQPTVHMETGRSLPSHQPANIISPAFKASGSRRASLDTAFEPPRYASSTKLHRAFPLSFPPPWLISASRISRNKILESFFPSTKFSRELFSTFREMWLFFLSPETTRARFPRSDVKISFILSPDKSDRFPLFLFYGEQLYCKILVEMMAHFTHARPITS